MAVPHSSGVQFLTGADGFFDSLFNLTLCDKLVESQMHQRANSGPTRVSLVPQASWCRNDTLTARVVRISSSFFRTKDQSGDHRQATTEEADPMTVILRMQKEVERLK
jgi:hypothetical protein